MDNKPLNQHGGSVAAPTKITYSAQELAELYFTSREDFLGLDLEHVTCNWSDKFIYEFLYHIRDVNLFDDIIEWMILCWKSKRQYYKTFDRVTDKDLFFACSEFEERLRLIKVKLIECFESERHYEELRAKMLAEYKQNSINTTPLELTKPAVETIIPQSVFTPQSTSNNEYHIDLTSLPENIQNKILVSQNVFDVYVNQLNTDVWPLTVSSNRGRYCDPLRFLSIKHEIVSKNMEREDFDTLLHQVVFELKGQPSLMSSMGRYSLTSSQKIKSSLAYYDSPVKNHQEKVWQLIKDCAPLEEGLQPVYDAMEAEALMAKSEVLQV